MKKGEKTVAGLAMGAISVQSVHMEVDITGNKSRISSSFQFQDIFDNGILMKEIGVVDMNTPVLLI